MGYGPWGGKESDMAEVTKHRFRKMSPLHAKTPLKPDDLRKAKSERSRSCGAETLLRQHRVWAPGCTQHLGDALKELF